MKNYLILLLALIAATSCTKYNISGSSDLQDMDGRMLFLKAIVDGEMKNVDSCDVVHGKFKFCGALDSVQVVNLCVDNSPVMPIVLEDGTVEVELNAQRQTAKGTPLNDTLQSFTKQYEQLALQIDDLSHQQSQAIMNGEDMDEVNSRLSAKGQELLVMEDKLFSTFIADNFDNCLSVYVFQLVTSNYEYPMLTPWIDALMTKATDTFKTHPYVKEYMEMAQHNQDVMTGNVEPEQMTAPAPAPTLPAPPTPNEMAAQKK